MKIAVVADHIPSQFAHSFHFMKTAQGFFDLKHQIEILVVKRFVEVKNKFKTRDVYDFYSINHRLKLIYFLDKFLSFFREMTIFKKIYYPSLVFLRKIIPRVEDILDPERIISKYCKVNKFDLVYCRRTYNLIYYNILNKIPTILEAHNFDLPNDMKLIMKLTRSKYFKALITINNILKNNFIKFGVPEEKIMVLEDAVDLDNYDKVIDEKNAIRKKLELPINKILICYSGNLKNDRGIDTIIIASKFLKEKNVTFIIVGGKKQEIKKWKKFKSKNGIDSSIYFLGFKNNKYIPYYLKSADILLAPYSLKCKTVQWMSPLKLFEYMASKVPIIASDVVRLKEICNNNECLFFKADNPKDLSEKISLLIEDVVLQKTLTNNAYKKSLHHSYLNRCKKILNGIK